MSARPLQNEENAANILGLGLEEPSDLRGTLRRIASNTRRLFAADLCAIAAINPITGQIVLPPTTTDLDGAAELDHAQLQAILAYARDQGIVFVEDVRAHPEYQRLFAPLDEMRSFAAITLRADEDQRDLAVLCLSFKTSQQFTDERRELLFASTDAIGPILRHLWMMHRYRVVARIGQEINHELETADLLFQKLQARIATILDTSHFFLLAVYQPQSNTLDLHMSLKGAYEARSDFPLSGACEYVIEQQSELIINRLSSASFDPVPPVIPLPGTNLHEESLIFIPLSLRDVPYGVLSVQHLKPDVYTSEDVHILRLLGNYIALALSNLRLYDNVLRLNEAGQFLTQQLESEQVLQGVAEQIRATTRADIVTLYPYDRSSGEFERPPRRSGELLASGMRPLGSPRSDDIVELMITRAEPLFVDSALLYQSLGGDPQERQGGFSEREHIRSTSALPLRVVDEPVGVLFVNFRRAQRFDASQRQLIQGLANYAAIAIKNSREFGAEARRRLEELQLLRQIDREISKTLDLQEVMQTILNMATDHIKVDAASIILYNSQTKILRMEAAVGRHIPFKQLFQLHTDKDGGITSWVFKNKQPMRVGNVRTDPAWKDVYVRASAGTRSELDVPLLEGDDVIGVINFESDTENSFDQNDEDFLVTVADRAALAVKNAQAYEREKRIAKERQALIDISRQIIQETDIDRIFEPILMQALEVTRSKSGTLSLYDPQRNELWIAAERGVRQEHKNLRVPLGKGIVGRVAQSKKLLNIGDVTAPEWSEIFVDSIPDVHSELAVPLLEGEQLRGVLNIESPDPNHFDESDERLLTALADQSMVALQTIERYTSAEAGNALKLALYEVDQTIIRQLDNHDQVMETLLNKARELTGAEIADLGLYEQDKLHILYRARLDAREQALPIKPISAAEAFADGLELGIISQAATTREPYRTNGDAQRDPYYRGDPTIRSELAVPLLVGKDELIGVLNVESKRYDAFDDKSLEVLEALARQAVIAIQSAQNYANAKIARRRFQLLHQVGQRLAEISDLAEMNQAYEMIIHTAEQHFKSQVVIRRYDEQAQELVVMLAEGYQGAMPLDRIKIDESVSGEVARTRQTKIIPDVEDPEAPIVHPAYPNARSLVIAPILFKHRYYGNLGFSHTKAGYFQKADVDLIEGLAQQLAITIHRLEVARAQQEMEQRAGEAVIMASIGQANFELAHRLGNDLGLVRTYVNNIRMELDDHGIANYEIAEELDKIVSDVGRALKLSKDLKQELAGFRDAEQEAKRAVGQPLGERVVMPVAELLEETRQALPAIPPHVRLDWQIEAGAARVRIVPSQIIALFANLVMNAIQAMPQGGAITFRARNAGRYIDFEIEDTGIGIDLDKQAKIFDMFYTTRESSGFGLWSARHNALANGGELSVRSAPGQGATFTLRLPSVE